MLLRLLLIALAAAAVVVLSVRLGDHDACQDARRALFASAALQAGREAATTHVETIGERCRGSDALVAAAGALRTLGDRERALALAREAARREPESFAAWRAVAALARGREARDARRRGRALNPRWAPAPRRPRPQAAVAGGGP